MKLDADFILSLVEDGEVDKTDLRIIRAIRGTCELTPSAIAKESGIPRTTVLGRLAKLRTVITRAQITA